MPKDRKSRVTPFQIVGLKSSRPGNFNQVLQFGPRYSPPLDNTLVLCVFHRTMGHSNSNSALLDDLQVAELATWFAGDDPAYDLPDRQQSAELRRGADGSVTIHIYWNGSRRGTAIDLNPDQVALVAEWLTNNALTYEWNGWLRPLDVPQGQHGHFRIGGVMQPCRLCVLKGTTPRLLS